MIDSFAGCCARRLMCSKPRITPYQSLEKGCCASQHFGPPDFRNGSKPERLNTST
jgi:hypothetical protein